SASATTPLVIHLLPKPTKPTIATSKDKLCVGEEATLTATGCNGTVVWSNGTTGTSIIVNTTGTYNARCETVCGTSDASNVITITPGDTPSAPVITPANSNLCNGASVTLTANGCSGTVKWNTNATGSSLVVSIAGTYSAVCINSCGTSSTSNVATIVTGNTPNAPVVAANNNTLCNGASATLTATGCSGTVKWSTTATGTSIIVNVAGTYSATCSNSCGESVDSLPVVIITGSTPIPPTIITTSNSLCNGASATLTANGCLGTVKWSNNATGTSITVTTAGTYNATCSNSCGTSGASNVITITTGNTPVAPIISSDKASLCSNEMATLTATGCNGTVKWSNNATGASITVTTAGTYNATCSNSCGTSGASNVITITTGTTPPAPTIASNKLSLCNGETATLTATGCNGTVKWSNSSTGTSINVTTAGTYSATCSNSCGTSGASNVITITTGTTPPAPTIATNTNSLCN
ncbi:hypothetical protein H1R81_27310, partial [Emticicia sp. BO119]|nr:hypothetical protein [Emticicia sp. BO119]